MDNDCLFCKIVRGKIPSAKVYEDELVFAFLDINPVAEGHVLIVPKKHFANIFEVDEESLSRIAVVAKKIAIAEKNVLHVENLNLVQSNGKAAQQEVMHFHLHLWPRSPGDEVKLEYPPKLELRSKMKETAEKLRSAL